MTVQQQRKSLFRLAVIGAAAAAVVAVLVALSQSETSKSSAPVAGEPPAGGADVGPLFRGIPQNGTVLGDPKAPLTMVEFADLQCPFCGEYARDALPTIVERYVRTGKLRLELRLLRFIGPDSERAAQVAVAAAAQDRMWQFVDLFYRNQGMENTGYATDEFLRKLARATPGLDAERAMHEALDAEGALRRAESEATRYGIDSTPSFLVGRTGGPLRQLHPAALEPGAFTGLLDQLLRSP